MDLLPIPDILNTGINGLIFLVVLLALAEVRSARRDQIEIIKIVLKVDPEAINGLPQDLKRQVERAKLNRK